MQLIPKPPSPAGSSSGASPGLQQAQGAQQLIWQLLGAQHFPVSSEVRIPRNTSCALSVLLPQHRACITTNHPGPAGRAAKGEEARLTSLNKAEQAGLVLCPSTLKTAGFWCICYLSLNQQTTTALLTSRDRDTAKAELLPPAEDFYLAPHPREYEVPA